MPPVAFKATIPASARPQTYALDRAAAGMSEVILGLIKKKNAVNMYAL
jgi:hypothetical protein